MQILKNLTQHAEPAQQQLDKTGDPLIPWLRAELSRVLELAPDQIANDTPLLELGLDSLAAVRLCATISEKVGFDVDPVLVFDHPTIAEIADVVAKERLMRAQPT